MSLASYCLIFMLPPLLKLNNIIFKAKMLHAKFLTVAHNLGKHPS